MIISLLFFVVTLFDYFTLILPASDEGQKVKAEMISRQNFIDNQKQAIKQIQNLISSYKGEGQLQEVVSSVLPSSEDLAGAFGQINGLVAANHLLLQGTSVGASVDMTSFETNKIQAVAAKSLTKPFSAVDFQVKMTGTYEDFKSFLGNMETNIRIFDVKKINMQPAGKSNQNIYAFDLTIATYYQKP